MLRKKRTTQPKQQPLGIFNIEFDEGTEVYSYTSRNSRCFCLMIISASNNINVSEFLVEQAQLVELLVGFNVVSLELRDADMSTGF